MYKTLLKVESSKINGRGLFTPVSIPAMSPVLEILGPIKLDREIPPTTNTDAYTQVGPNTYLALSGEVDDYLNHSCDPNCRLLVVGNRAILFSLYIIPVGAELTFDYSTTSTDTHDTWKMNCTCGSYKCRKVISGFQYLDQTLKDNYISRSMVPLFITDPNLIHKR